MKQLLFLTMTFLFFNTSRAQVFKKLKEKAKSVINQTTDKPVDKTTEKTSEAPSDQNNESIVKSVVTKSGDPLKVYSKFDFVPGSTILYYDNFEKDNIGETPLGWLTSSSAEVVTIDGQEGNWLKLKTKGSSHLIRNKKQSWGRDFTVEFDMLVDEKGKSGGHSYSIILLNSGSKTPADETLIDLISPGKTSFESYFESKYPERRTGLYKNKDKLSDGQELLPYTSGVPIHISMCVQGKRFRMWWNDKKLYDLSAIDEAYLPNQLAFSFHYYADIDFYVNNFRIAKDIPDTRTKFDQGKLVSNLLFFTGTANLKPESMGALLDVSKVIKEASSTVKIIGYTDSDGNDAANLKLSEQRAEAVKDILIKQYGIDEKMLTTEGRGEDRPIAENTSSEGKAQNRRVEFIFKPEADKYEKAGSTSNVPGDNASTKGSNAGNKKISPAATTVTGNSVSAVNLQSKPLNTNLPYASFSKSGDGKYTFIASKEEGNTKEDFIKIELNVITETLKPETYYFAEINKTKPAYGSKQYPEIKATKAVLYYGSSKKPYINLFSPIIANGHMANYYSESLEKKLPAASPNCKFVIESITDGKASGYFVLGIVTEGLKPITRGDAMTETFTTGFSGEMRCKFNNVPVY